MAGGGASTPQAAFTNTWNIFAGLNVQTWDSRSLQYYPSEPVAVPFSGCATTAQQLVTGGGSGQCGAFQLLVLSALQLNGIGMPYSTTGQAVLIGVFAINGSRFMVNTWTYGSMPGTPGVPLYPGYGWTLRLTSELQPKAPPVYGIFAGMVPANVPPTYGYMTSCTGLPGQNSGSPSEKLFGSHYIFQISEDIAGGAGPSYFDPSYGLTYADPATFEKNAVAGYGTWLADGYSGTTPVWSDYGVTQVGATVNICFSVGSSPATSYPACTIF